MQNGGVAAYQGAGVIPAAERFGGGKPPGPPLQPPSGGGPFDGMEARVARLESDVEHIKADVGDIKSSLNELTTQTTELRINFARLDERVSHLPTKGFLVTTVLVALGVIAALVVFQGNIQRFLGAPASTLPLPSSITAPGQKPTP
jgi:hypothetical protein